MQIRITTADSSVSADSRRDSQDGAGHPSSQRLQSGPAFDDEWRRWIAENLLLGADPSSIVEVLGANGFARDQSAIEIDAARQSPYFRASPDPPESAQEARLAPRLLPQARAAQARLGRGPASAPAVTRRIPSRVLLVQSPGHHHGCDGRLAGHVDVEPRLLRRLVRRPRGQRPDESRLRAELRDQLRPVRQPDPFRRVRADGPRRRLDQ